jgi:hypothetical protein
MDDGDTGLAAMVIVVPNRTVNRTSRLVICRCAAGIFAISCAAAQSSHLHPVHREP